MGRPCEETKRVSRILELVQLVAASPRRFRRRDLAGRFEVSERMIQKDLEIVRHGLKLPLFRSLNGYYFEKTPALPVLQLNFSEALALLLAVQAAGSVSGIGSPELAAAVARLEAVFPREFTVLLRRFASDKPAAAQEHRQRMLMLLKRALIEGCKVRMIYETRSRGGEANERVVCPYHLMPYVRSWQLIAYCEWRQKVRIFKVDRVREAMLLDERYRVPEDFDLAAYLGPAWGIMRGGAGDTVDVVLRFEPETGRRVAEEHWHSSQQAEEQPDGSILFKLHLPVTPDFISWLLYYGNQVRIIEPQSLREQVAEEHRKAWEISSLIIP